MLRLAGEDGRGFGNKFFIGIDFGVVTWIGFLVVFWLIFEGDFMSNWVIILFRGLNWLFFMIGLLRFIRFLLEREVGFSIFVCDWGVFGLIILRFICGGYFFGDVVKVDWFVSLFEESDNLMIWMFLFFWIIFLCGLKVCLRLFFWIFFGT